MNPEQMAMWSLIVAVVSILVSFFFGWQQFKEKIELAYPIRKAHQRMCYIKPFSQEIDELASLLFNNIDRKVYLSIGISEEDVIFYDDEEESVAFVSINYQKLCDFKDGEVASPRNSLTLTINVEKNKNSISKCYSSYGFIEIGGYFWIKNSGGPRMGGMWVTLTACGA